MDLRISHDTHYRYAQPVHSAHHVAHLSPSDTVTQKVLTHELDINPKPDAAHCAPRLDAFGNRVLQWQTVGTHSELRVEACSTVRTWALPEREAPTLSWAQAAERYAYRSAQASDAAAAFTFPSAHVPKAAAFADYAAPSFNGGTPLVEAALDLLRRMDEDFTYVSQSTTIHTPALVALTARRGVCQDFAHIILACLRNLGLAARYVSGYLLTEVPEGQVRLRGSDASHAWVALHVPSEDGSHPWLHLDPTNHRSGWGSPGPDYVTLACGRDFADVSPLRGVLQGGATHQLQVGVTVEPWPPALEPTPAS